MSLATLVVTVIMTSHVTSAQIRDEEKAAAWLREYNERAQEVYFRSVSAAWAYNTNLTDHNQKLMDAAQLEEAEFNKASGQNASLFDWKSFTDATLKRQFSKVSQIGVAALNDTKKIERITNVLSTMEALYSKAKVCDRPGGGACAPLDPDLTRIMRESRDYDELLWAWNGWRQAAGVEVGKLYPEFVELSNEAAQANGWADTGASWRSWYESDTFRKDVENLWQTLKPLYQKLHAFVRRWLRQKYGENKFPETGHIPAHLLGNMWAQTWGSLFNDLRPYPDKESVDVTPQMIAQGYTARRMFEISDEFFTSLGLDEMPQKFWDKSMITKPEGRDVVCHASAWDFYNQQDFRIKQCTVVNMEDLITVHHEMGHIEYYLLYKNQPVMFRRGANPGFHEAVGDVLALSVATPAHLQKIGLLDNVEDDEESDINYLLSIALDKIAFLPFGYLMDQWRWAVFDGSITPQTYNQKWWNLRCRYQGIFPPSDRTNTSYFDPGAKYHIPGNTPYIRYFVSFVLQFQFHKALCDTAGELDRNPLHKCDIYQNLAAGTQLRKMLEKGSSEPWQDVLQEAIGTRQMSAEPLVEYFQPLINWLDKENAKYPDDRTDWDESKCPAVPNVTEGGATIGLFPPLLFMVFFRWL